MITLMSWSNYSISPGDTSRFINNFNNYLNDLEVVVGEINSTTQAVGQTAQQVFTARDQARNYAQIAAGQVFDDSKMSVLTGWTSQKVSAELGNKVDNSRVLTDVPADAVFTDTRDANEIVQSATHRFVTDEEKAHWTGLRNARFEQKYFGGM